MRWLPRPKHSPSAPAVRAGIATLGSLREHLCREPRDDHQREHCDLGPCPPIAARDHTRLGRRRLRQVSTIEYVRFDFLPAFEGDEGPLVQIGVTFQLVERALDRIGDEVELPRNRGMAACDEGRVLAEVDQLEIGRRADSPTAFTAGEQVVVRAARKKRPVHEYRRNSHVCPEYGRVRYGPYRKVISVAGAIFTSGVEVSRVLGPSRMARMVQCVKLQRELEGLDKPPFKGEVGQRVFDNVSKEAWRMWLEHSKMIVNEYRLDLVSPQGQKVWMEQLEKYFFGEGSALPPDFVAPKEGK